MYTILKISFLYILFQSVIETGQSIRGKIRTVNYKYRILKKHEDHYDLKELAHDLQDIYLKALELLQE